MNPARLAELERQRTLVRLHLEWLEKEIATEAGTTPAEITRAAPTPSPQPTAAAVIATTPTSIELSTPPASQRNLTDSYEPDPVSAAASARRGCLLCLCVALVLGTLALTALYFTRYRNHPLFHVSGENSAPGKISSPSPSSVRPPK